MSPSGNPAVAVVELVQQVKEAILEIERQPDRTVRVAKVQLEIKAVLERGLGGEHEFKLVPAKLSGSYTEAEIQTICVILTPPLPSIFKTHEALELKDELVRAVNVIKIAVAEAARSSPVFGLGEAVVLVHLGVTEEGALTVLTLGASAKAQTTHTVKLTLASA